VQESNLAKLKKTKARSKKKTNEQASIGPIAGA
jgi:hypothetical protein